MIFFSYSLESYQDNPINWPKKLVKQLMF